ncbi:MAG: DUF4007 family protein [Desulfobacteraceae bacterium]|nr:DUF4007 family protein [Desulfobacteraceae bacterium]
MNQSFRFNLNDKASLPDSVFLAACFEYAFHHFNDSNMTTISLNKLIYGFNSPGAVFKLSESEVGNRLERSIRKIQMDCGNL